LHLELMLYSERLTLVHFSGKASRAGTNPWGRGATTRVELTTVSLQLLKNAEAFFNNVWHPGFW